MGSGAVSAASGSGDPAALPFVDEHSIVVAAPPEAVRRALESVLIASFGSPRAAAAARALGCREAARSAAANDGRLDRGATVPGFRVARSAPRKLALEGRHRFSRYTLVFRIDPVRGGVADSTAAVRLSAETRARFPGVAGRGYRLLVIGTRGHVVLVRRLLRSVRRRAERA